MSVHETAEMLHITVHTLYAWLKLPDPPPSHQIVPKGRRLFIESEVHDWVQARSRCIEPAAGLDVA
jgi:predicted DNA-binding transcriptional regulator AlpA